MNIDKNYIPVQGNECLNSCLCNFLSIWGTPLDSSVICFGGSGFKIGFCNDDKLFIFANVFQSDFDFMKRYNIDYSYTQLEQTADSKKSIISMVDEGRYFCIKVSSRCLTYNRVFLQNDSLHYINIVDYDLENNKLLIIDGFVPTVVPSTFFGWVDMNQLLSGWEKSGYNYVEFFKPSNLDVKQIKSDFRSNIIEQLQDYLYKSYKVDGIVYGYNAFLALFNELIEIPVDDLPKTVLDINYQIRIHGLMASRYYLRNAVGLLLNQSEMYNAVKNFISKWNSVCMMLVKASFKKNSDFLKSISNDVTSIIESENDLFKEIIRKLSDE